MKGMKTAEGLGLVARLAPGTAVRRESENTKAWGAWLLNSLSCSRTHTGQPVAAGGRQTQTDCPLAFHL